jgi:hypothetical protein
MFMPIPPISMAQMRPAVSSRKAATKRSDVDIAKRCALQGCAGLARISAAATGLNFLAPVLLYLHRFGFLLAPADMLAPQAAIC